MNNQTLPTQNKLWPINWKHNKAFKILELIFIFVFFAFLLLPTYLSPYTHGPRGFCGIAACPLDASDIIFRIIEFRNSSSVQINLIIALTLYILFVALKLKKLDAFDKILFVCNFLILISFFFSYVL